MSEIFSSNPPVVTGICDSNNSRAWYHHRSNMCVGCFEISVSVVVKHVKSTGILGFFVCLGGLVKIFSAWGDRKLLGCGLLGEDQYPG